MPATSRPGRAAEHPFDVAGRVEGWGSYSLKVQVEGVLLALTAAKKLLDCCRELILVLLRHRYLGVEPPELCREM